MFLTQPLCFYYCFITTTNDFTYIINCISFFNVFNYFFGLWFCKLPLFLDHFGLEFLGVFSNSRETD
jgi:hypothetical protein